MTDLTTTTQTAGIDPAVLEKVLGKGDLSTLDSAQRVNYLGAVCRSAEGAGAAPSRIVATRLTRRGSRRSVASSVVAPPILVTSYARVKAAMMSGTCGLDAGYTTTNNTNTARSGIATSQSSMLPSALK